MASSNFIPSREADLVTWSNNFSTLIAATPATFGLTSGRYPGTTDTERLDLGLNVPDTTPSPVPAPEAAPAIEIVQAVGRLVKLRLWDTENIENRGKPAGVSGATLLSYVGAAPPAPEDIAAWKFEANISRTTAGVEFSPTVPSGATAWFTAFWFNPRKQSGPAAQPVSTQIPASLPAAA